jgi:hypothetical protein
MAAGHKSDPELGELLAEERDEREHDGAERRKRGEAAAQLQLQRNGRFGLEIEDEELERGVELIPERTREPSVIEALRVADGAERHCQKRGADHEDDRDLLSGVAEQSACRQGSQRPNQPAQ